MANVTALEMHTSENIFNIGTGTETTVNQLFNHLKNLLNIYIEEKHAPAQQGEQLRSVIDCERAKNLLNWIPNTSLLDGLKKTCDFFKQE